MDSTWCYRRLMVHSPLESPRVFKSAWFAKAAKKALIKDAELCDAFEEMLKGQCQDLGGGAYKKRLDKNRHRSIVLSKSRLHWIYQYLFAKKNRDNIDEKELESFRKLAKNYEILTPAQLAKLLEAKDLTEICNADKAKIQK